MRPVPTGTSICQKMCSLFSKSLQCNFQKGADSVLFVAWRASTGGGGDDWFDG
jgi:hypothetical protein